MGIQGLPRPMQLLVLAVFGWGSPPEVAWNVAVPDAIAVRGFMLWSGWRAVISGAHETTDSAEFWFTIPVQCQTKIPVLILKRLQNMAASPNYFSVFRRVVSWKIRDWLHL